MDKMHEYVLSKGYECFSKYVDSYKSCVTEYFCGKNRIAFIEKIDNIQILFYINEKYLNYVVPSNTDDGLDKLKEVFN